MYVRTACVLRKKKKKIQWLGELAQKNEFINNLPSTHGNFVFRVLLSSCDFSPPSGFLHCQTSVWSPLGAQKEGIEL